MPRIPIYTSRRPMQRPSPVYPPAGMGTQVSEALGGLARTVGKVAENWATAKANTEKQSEYVSNTITYKEAQAAFLKEQQDSPDYMDDKELLSKYETDMGKVKDSLVWKYDSIKKQFGSTSQLSDSAFMQNAYNLNRRKFIDSKKVQGETNTQNALRLRSQPLLDQNIESLKNVYSKEELKLKENRDNKALQMLQAGDKLKIDLNADLSEFKLIKDEVAGLRTKAKKVAIAEKKRLKAIRQDELKKQQAELDKNNVIELRNHTFTYDKLLEQKPVLSAIQFRYFDKALATVPPEKSDPKVKADLYKRLGLGLLTRTNIMNAYGKLNDPDMKELEKRWATVLKDEWGFAIDPNKYQQATKEVDKTLSELVEDNLMSKQDMEEARTNVIYKLFDISREKNLADDEILEQKEKLMLPYYKKQSQLLNDNRVWHDFITGRKAAEEMKEKVKELEISTKEEFKIGEEIEKNGMRYKYIGNDQWEEF